MVESKKRNQTAISKQQKQQTVLKKAKKVAAPVIVEPEIEEPIIEQEEEEVAQVEEEDDDENKIAFNNDEKEEEEQQDDDYEMQDDNEEEEEEKVEKSIRSKSNDELLCARFISTMAATFTNQLQGKNTHVSALRGLYFESINQIKHESIRELLFKPSSWHKFYRIVKKIIKTKNAEIQDDENKEDDEEQQQDDEQLEEEEEQQEEEEEDVISNVIFKNLLSYQVIGGRESLIQQIQDNESTSTDKINHLYKQSISIDSKLSNKYTSIINSFFATSALPTHELLDKFIMYSLTLGEVTNEIIDILNLILESASTNDSNNNAKIYKSLRQFLSISILEKLYKESSKVGMIKSNVMLATQLFKFSLLNSSNTSNEYMESDYSTIKLLLGKVGFLPKLVSLMTSFDFTLDQYNSSNSKNNNNFISILLKQFIKESQLSTPPTNSISYLKSRILCERGIIVLTKLKDPLLTKLKISSATLPIPESLLNFFNSNQQLLVKTHKSMDNNQAIRLLKLNSLVDILTKVQEIERKENEQNDQDEDNEDDYVDDHFTINKNGNASEQLVKELPKETNEDDEEQTEKELEESIENMEGAKSLLDFLDEDDLKSDDEEDQE